MKTTSTIESLLKTILIALFLMTIDSELMAQEKKPADLNEFKNHH